MAHRFEPIPRDAEPQITLTDDIHEAPVRVWVDYSPYGGDDLCLVFEDASTFRAWLDGVIGEADRHNLTHRELR